jgi:NADH dehydrogenase
MIERAEELVTVFGGDGFIGRYVCELLMRSGVRIRVASRDPRKSFFIQPLGQVGQFGFVQADITDAASVRRAVDDTSAVVNLVGVFGRRMEAVHVDGARNVAEAARDAGTRALVHVSAIGADPKSPSNYGRTKGEGELAVRKAFPKATMVRPSLVFGPEDDLTNRFAAMARLPFLPVIAAGRKFQPVYVRDVAQAIARAALKPQMHGGKIYEIGGPQVLTMAELNQTIVELSGQDTEIRPVSDVFGNLLSRFGWMPGSPLTRDQWLMLQRDNVAAKDALGLEAFGIEPTPLAAVAWEWLGRFRSGGKFSSRRIHLTAVS